MYPTLLAVLPALIILTAPLIMLVFVIIVQLVCPAMLSMEIVRLVRLVSNLPLRTAPPVHLANSQIMVHHV